MDLIFQRSEVIGSQPSRHTHSSIVHSCSCNLTQLLTVSTIYLISAQGDYCLLGFDWWQNRSPNTPTTHKSDQVTSLFVSSLYSVLHRKPVIVFILEDHQTDRRTTLPYNNVISNAVGSMDLDKDWWERRRNEPKTSSNSVRDTPQRLL
jgi:hypothetical protein